MKYSNFNKEETSHLLLMLHCLHVNPLRPLPLPPTSSTHTYHTTVHPVVTTRHLCMGFPPPPWLPPRVSDSTDERTNHFSDTIHLYEHPLSLCNSL
ncbi:hypothetical protein E2C01_033697 [Portunus trituberculatus]|uniref:Uncharacterized protein n=1 Tax=Portunus trituberculatus TaxID=210409 RepID=A0A5B7F0T1_PORTR|nr:hypothetical protein [Portunus trituberculatus]